MSIHSYSFYLVTAITFAVAVFLLLIVFVWSIKDRSYVTAIVAAIIGLFFAYISFASYGAYKTGVNHQKQKIAIRQELSKILSKNTKNKQAKAYIYGITLNGSYAKDAGIVECYKEFRNFKGTAECVKGLRK